MSKPLFKVASHLYQHLNTPRALACALLLRYGEWDQLATLAIDPLNYLDCPNGAEILRRDAQATDFIRKSPELPTTFNRRKAAEENFEVAESRCFRTNEFLTRVMYPLSSDELDLSGIRLLLGRMRKYIARVLGPVPDSLDCGFGPGTSYELKGWTYTTLMDKLNVTPCSTRSCRDLFLHFYDQTIWSRERIEAGLPHHGSARGCRFTTVPKNAKTDRGIAVEPLGNLYVQLGIGRFLKGRLARIGLFVDRAKPVPKDPVKALLHFNSPNGQVVHQRLARQASRTGDMATIDLSSASDTVARELVRNVLPPDWFALLDSARSHLCFFNKKWRHLEKFSSMGNGFTFELETLIFAACCYAVGAGVPGKDVFVYGDDIIVPTPSADRVIDALTSLGFDTNVDKTHTRGSFRESCGGDYFCGYPVRAVMVDSVLASPIEWIALHNRLWDTLPHSRGKKALLNLVRSQVPKQYRLSAPVTAGDSAFWTNDLSKVTVARRCKDEQGIYLKVVSPIVRALPLDRWSPHLHLSGVMLGIPSAGVVPRDGVSGFRVTSKRFLEL